MIGLKAKVPMHAVLRDAPLAASMLSPSRESARSVLGGTHDEHHPLAW